MKPEKRKFSCKGKNNSSVSLLSKNGYKIKRICDIAYCIASKNYTEIYKIVDSEDEIIDIIKNAPLRTDY